MKAYVYIVTGGYRGMIISKKHSLDSRGQGIRIYNGNEDLYPDQPIYLYSSQLIFLREIHIHEENLIPKGYDAIGGITLP